MVGTDLEAIFGVIAILVGAFLIGWHKYFARRVAEDQKALWGFRFSPWTVRVTEAVVVVIGVGFLLVGFMALFQIIRFKQFRLLQWWPPSPSVTAGG
jgi:hypothetical protein